MHNIQNNFIFSSILVLVFSNKMKFVLNLKKLSYGLQLYLYNSLHLFFQLRKCFFPFSIKFLKCVSVAVPNSLDLLPSHTKRPIRQTIIYAISQYQSWYPKKSCRLLLFPLTILIPRAFLNHYMFC